MPSLEEDNVNRVLRNHPSIIEGCLDVDVLHFLSSVVADKSSGIDSAGALESFMAPFLDSFCLADEGSGEMHALCSSLFDELSAKGAIQARGEGEGGGLGGLLGGVSLEAAAALRHALGSAAVDGDGGATALKSSLTLGGSVALAGESVILDLLWARESNRFLQRNKEMEVGSSERGARKAAKLAAKAASREANRVAFSQGKAASAAAAELAAARRLGKSIAVTSGSVTYVPVMDRRPQDIHMEGVNIGYGGELLLVDCELHLVQGRRYGLVGRNGYGKTTLLKAMARHDIQGSGAAQFPTTIRVLHVEQEISAETTSVIDTVLAADVERAMLLDEEGKLMSFLEGPSCSTPGTGTASTLTAPSIADAGGALDGLTVASGVEADHRPSPFSPPSSEPPLTLETATVRMREVAARLEAIDALSAEARAGAILAGLQFTPEMLTWPTSALSGGWRMRVALACALFVQPDVLLLDEPTNHLDVPSCLWLENYLLDYPATAVIVSHDRRFLNNVVTDVIHLDQRKLSYYRCVFFFCVSFLSTL